MKNHPEKGSALLFILIAVVLFAALAYAVSDMMRGGSPDTISTEKAKLAADEILNYARSMQQAAQNIKISNGCADGDISFEATNLVGYGHTPAATDPCKIFNNDGGGLVYQPPVLEWLAAVSTPPALYGQWFFPGNVCAANTGTAGASCSTDSIGNEAIIAVLPYLKKELCLQLNNLLGVTNPGGNPPAETSNAWTVGNVKFTGAQTDGEQMDQGARPAGCFEGAVGSTPLNKTYHYFQILVPR